MGEIPCKCRMGRSYFSRMNWLRKQYNKQVTDVSSVLNLVNNGQMLPEQAVNEIGLYAPAACDQIMGMIDNYGYLAKLSIFLKCFNYTIENQTENTNTLDEVNELDELQK